MQTSIKIQGRSGRLRAGSRPAATLGAWRARHVDGRRWAFEFESYRLDDPYQMEYGGSWRLVLDMGRSTIQGPCEIVSREPLIIEMEMPES